MAYKWRPLWLTVLFQLVALGVSSNPLKLILIYLIIDVALIFLVLKFR